MENHFTSIATTLIAIGSIGACRPAPAIDGTTEATFAASVEDVRASVPASQQDQLGQAMETVTFAHVSMTDAIGGNIEARMRAALHGRTANEILAAADSIIESRRETIMREIATLEQRRSRVHAAADDLGGLEILGAQYQMEEDSYYGLRGDAVVTLHVRNSTAHPIARAEFNGVLQSPGRSVPWANGLFEHDVPGGLEPGETATWRIALDGYGRWGFDEPPPSDAQLHVSVVRLIGSDPSAFPSEVWSSEDEDRLEELKQRIR